MHLSDEERDVVVGDFRDPEPTEAGEDVVAKARRVRIPSSRPQLYLCLKPLRGNFCQGRARGADPFSAPAATTNLFDCCFGVLEVAFQRLPPPVSSGIEKTDFVASMAARRI